MPTLNLPDSVSINIGRGGKYGTLTVDTSRFNDAVQAYIYDYGLRQCLNDAAATKTDDAGEPLSNGAVLALAEKRLANMYTGELRAHRATGEPADPIEAEVRKIAVANIRAMLGHVAVPSDVKGPIPRLLHQINTSRAERKLAPVADIAGAVDLYMAGPKGKAVRASAERIVRERQGAVGELADSGI